MSDFDTMLSKPVNGQEPKFWKYMAGRSKAMENRLPNALKGQGGRLLAVAKAYIEGMKPDDYKRVMKCSCEAVEGVIMKAADFGLPLDGRHCYLVVYGTDPALVPSYIGMIAVARRVGTIDDARAFIVLPSDDFSYEDDGDVKMHFKPNLSAQRDYTKAIGVCTVIDYARGKRIAWMCKADIEKRRAVAPSKDGPWSTWPEEMALKTGLRHELKTMSDDPAMIALFKLDDAHNDLERLMSRPVNDGAFERLRASLKQPGDDIATDALDNIGNQTPLDVDGFELAAAAENAAAMEANK